ncbi:hypothetical protein ACP4OV_014510 [Aristida adscensionis]
MALRSGLQPLRQQPAALPRPRAAAGVRVLHLLQ